MKKRIFALLLCLVMLASMIPLMGASAAENGGAGVVGVSPAAAAVSEDSKAVITAAGGDGAYQWQIYAGNDVWANIAGQTGAQLTVSYGMVCGLMDGGKAYVRCRVTNGENEAYSSPVEIVITGNEEENSGGIALFARRAARPVTAEEPVGTVVREAYVLGEPVITMPGAATPAPTATPAAEATPAPTATPAAEATPAPAEDNSDAPAEEPAAETPAENGTEAAPVEPAPEAAEAPADSPVPTAEAGEENTAAPAQDAEAAPVAARSAVAPALRFAPVRRLDDVTPEKPAAAEDVPAASPSAAPETYHIRINYVFEDGTQAANPWTAKLAAGSGYSATVVSPAIVGYAPDKATVAVNVTNIASDVVYEVIYMPSEVNYTVNHYIQNTMDDGYTLADTVTGKAFTNVFVSTLGDLSKDYEGCYSLLYDDTVRIAADGSTVIDIKYDRKYFLLNFDLAGGYGVEPIYARYGAPVTVGTPTRAGYIFAGWDTTPPVTVPAYNGKFTAQWTEDKAGFTVVFWYENADDNGYSVAGTYGPVDVAPDTTVKSDDYKNQSFTGRDTAHFTYNSAKAETVTVAGDGSTVLNVYYTRNTYTLTFRVLDCNKWWHTHSDSCYKTVQTITAKYGENISGEFGKAPFTTTYNGRAWICTESSKFDYALQTLDRMPGFDATFELYDKSSNTKKTIYYYVQKVGNTTVNAGQWPSNANNFDLLKQVDTYFNYATYDEEYHEILGFTRYSARVSGFTVNGQLRKDFSNNRLNLYYMRNSYTLKFYNYDAFVDGKGGSVQYEAPLGSYDFTPDYPAGLEPNAYKFAGWYTTAGCYAGSEADLSTMKMPASDLILYAKWVPVTHAVKTWLTVDKETPVNVGETGSNVQTVSHGGKAEAPAQPERKPYEFIGWFYVDENGTEKAFDFSMPVNRDLDLYAKWNADQLVDYVIRYEDEAGNEIAPPTTGKALAGTTKTFDAKAGDELNESYRTGYYPLTNSHSMVMEIKEGNGKNEYTFVYKEMQEVPYTVRYINRATGSNVFDGVTVPEKTGTTNAAVWTETFLPITGYRPDAYQKRLVLSANPADNIITFYYEKDDVHAPVQVIHWTQNIAGESYTEYQSSTDLNGEIGNSYSAEPISIPGFEFKRGAVGSTETALVDGKLTATVTAEGLVLNLYYDRIEYPYEFRFLEQGTDNVLADAVTGSARYQARVTQTAKDIPGYTLVDDKNQNQFIDIAIEDPADTAVKNVRTFYYTEIEIDINYVAVEDDMGTVTPASETLKATTGEASGSTPKAKDGYKFVGWFKNEACTEPVDKDWVDADNKLTPRKTKNYGTEAEPVMGYVAATYYAKFEDDVAQLTITKNGAELVDESQSFVFKVTGPNGYSERVVICGNGSVTIKNLKPGKYNVTEEGWSWRYTGDGTASATISASEPGSVTFNNVRQTEGSHPDGANGWKWLGGDACKINLFN